MEGQAFVHRASAPNLFRNSTSSSISVDDSQNFKGPEKLRGLKRLSAVYFQPRFDHHNLVKGLSSQGVYTKQYYKSSKWDQEYWVHREKNFHDDADLSRHPSYTIKNVAYNVECQLLYMEAKEKYQAQFLKEMQHFIASKRKVSDQYFTKRILAYTTFWPPLHSKKELEIFKTKFFQLTSVQRKRLDYLLNMKLSEI
ncbi:uncharacterized protein LOC127566031 [Drosophila albomicans]|uniref:Uncharacterized protein LOC127566031 n=1 Tax=Drosophila albomicans TaxID=7291 RepID=A0A9C6WDE6_DROAB|nr:uncharacterized protein LOC127566031 [Drosophila albomicans]